MSKPRYGWWGYVKDMIRRYRTGDVSQSEKDAVDAAIAATEQLQNGPARMMVIDLVLWKGTHTLEGAALEVPCGERTARRWLYSFVLETAKNFNCESLIQ